MGLVVQILAGLAIFGVSTYLAALGFGLFLRRRGQLPFDAEALAADGGKYVSNSAGRRIEYFVYGSVEAGAPVVVNMHGSGPEARSERRLWAPACEALGVKGISISLPGYGYTDMNPGRVVKNWPKEDLEPVLDQEGVGEFMITGHSQGNPHAMAAALHFPHRCVGLGLNAPLLPSDVTREVGVKGALGMGSLLRTEQLRKPHMAWYFAVYHLGTVTFSPWLPMKALPAARKDPGIRKIFWDTFERPSRGGATAARGSRRRTSATSGRSIRARFRPRTCVSGMQPTTGSVRRRSASGSPRCFGRKMASGSTFAPTTRASVT